MRRALLAIAALVACSTPPPVPPAPPPSAGNPVVEMGLVRRRLASLSAVGDVSDVRIDAGGERVLVTGTCGLAILPRDGGGRAREIAFAVPCPPFLGSRFADVDGDGSTEIVRFDTGWAGGSMVLELDGTVRWSVEWPCASEHVLDLDRDGREEILIREVNQARVRLLDCDGRIQWQQDWPSEPNHAVPLDVDGDGLDEIAVTDGRALWVYEGARGVLLFRTSAPRGGYLNLLAPCTDGDARLWLGEYHDGEQLFHALAGDARTVLRSTPLDPTAWTSAAIGGGYRLESADSLEQAYPAGFSGSSVELRLVGPDGVVLMTDTLSPDEGATLAGAHAVLVNEDPLRVLVGYGETVWEYREPAER